MKIRSKISFPAILALVLFIIPVSASQASEVDFSCISHTVWSKDHLSSKFMDHDIVLQNDCPGAVYWSMCIERIDPWTGEIMETHNPTGYIEAEKKARVNLHMKQGENRKQFRRRFQEFYVSFGYGIEKLVPAQCAARRCEDQKSALRAQIRANEKAWESVQNSLSSKIASDCPDTGWDETTRAECAAQLRGAVQGDLTNFSRKDRDLRAQMAAIDPENCTLWSGELTSD